MNSSDETCNRPFTEQIAGIIAEGVTVGVPTEVETCSLLFIWVFISNAACLVESATSVDHITLSSIIFWELYGTKIFLLTSFYISSLDSVIL